ncbi:MAG: FAD-binding oxidoreductase [Bacteroidetes bacterium]|nr:FAD-binding oxidoreductase [Bacteroidota bacterium]
MQVQTIIAGAGLAGCSLALELHSRGHRVFLADNQDSGSSSRVAAGLVNPIVPKGVKKTWMCDTFFPGIRDWYARWDFLEGQPFFQSAPLWQIHKSYGEYTEWRLSAENPEMEGYLLSGEPHNHPGFSNDYGSTLVYHAGRLNTLAFCNAVWSWFSSLGQTKAQSFNYDEIIVDNDSVQLWGVRADRLVFCDGASGMNNPWFSYLPWRPSAGDILRVRTEGMSSLSDRAIYRHRHWLVPDGKGDWLAGGSFHPDNTDRHPNHEDAEEILTSLRGWIHHPVHLLQHLRGIRPSVQDRRPFIGRHPANASVWIFNGLGSKGSSLVTWLAPVLADAITVNAALPAEVDINRYRYPGV